MKSTLEKDKRKRLNFLKWESSRKLLKSISCNLSLSSLLRVKAFLALSNLPKSSTPARIKRRCIVTGRGRFILKSFNMSRLTIRKLARCGLVPGLRKSSW